MCYVHSVPEVSQSITEDEESRDRKAELRTGKHHRCPSPTATTSIDFVTLCHHKHFDLQCIHLLIRLGKCHVCFLRRGME